MMKNRRAGIALRGAFAGYARADVLSGVADLKERVLAHVLDKPYFVSWNLPAAAGDRTATRVHLPQSRGRKHPRRKTMKVRLKYKCRDARAITEFHMQLSLAGSIKGLLHLHVGTRRRLRLLIHTG
jgi:hypothetical protein